MPYEKDLDKTLFSKTVDFETTRIVVSIMSYNGATPKLQISRENLTQGNGEWRFSKLGRLTKEEAKAILPVIEKALSEM